MSLTSSRRLLTLCVFALCISFLAMASLAVANPAMAQDELPRHHPLGEATISVTGTGIMTAEPDIAIVQAGAVTEGATARAALDANTKIMADTFAALRALGVEDRDMQTSRLTVEPRYTYFEPVNGTRRPPRIDGYTVNNNLTVRVRDLAIIGEALDALISAGVNQMGGLSFAVDEPAALFMDARRAAVEDALAQARLLTGAAGVSLGRVISITQNNAYQQPPMPQMARMMVAEMDQGVPVASGEQELTAQVTIIWAIAQ
jgi:uncharacterized protein